MKERNQHEENVNNSMVAGIIMRKSEPEISQALLKHAHSTRLKSQKTQRKMNDIKASGTIDLDQKNLDLDKWEKADEKERMESRKRKAHKANTYRIYRDTISSHLH